MGFGKIWIPLFCLILILGFFLTRGSIAGLQEKADALKDAEQKVESVLTEWKDRFLQPAAVPTQVDPEQPPAEEQPAEAGAEAFACVLRVSEGKIGIFTPEGYLIRLLATDIRTLPRTDRKALEAGITVTSRAELLELMEDFGG